MRKEEETEVAEESDQVAEEEVWTRSGRTIRRPSRFVTFTKVSRSEWKERHAR